MAIAMLQEYVAEFQQRRKEVSDEVLKQYMTPRKLEWKGNRNPKVKEAKKEKSKESVEKGEKDKPRS